MTPILPTIRAALASIMPVAGAILGAMPIAALTADDYSGCAGTVALRTRGAGPGDYLSVLADLVPGDRVELAAGTYSGGLALDGVHGSPGSCIVIEGPASGPPAVFLADPCCNTVNLTDVSYLVLRHLELDGQDLPGVDAVKAAEDEGGAGASVHHLTLEALRILGHGGSQQTVGISSKCPAWNWVVRRCVIEGAGTGLYLGDSDGGADFSNSLIEHNLIRDTLGYNAQIKHQNARSTGVGAPASGVTVIRHNVFVKEANVVTPDGPRPNLLVGHWPLTGAGASDHYEIYGNFFFQNASGVEPLFQGSGHFAFYANLLVNDFGNGFQAQFHEGGAPRNVDVFDNTVVTLGSGISISGAEGGYPQRVAGNAVFAATPLSGGSQSENTAASQAAAASFLVAPDAAPGAGLDLTPDLAADGTSVAGAVDRSPFAAYSDFDRDFDGRPLAGVRGAYAGGPPLWPLALEPKPAADPLFTDGFESGDVDAWSAAFL